MARLEVDRVALAALCHRHQIRRIALFGSTLRGDERPASDVDLLVEFEPRATPGLLGLAGIEAELSTIRVLHMVEAAETTRPDVWGRGREECKAHR